MRWESYLVSGCAAVMAWAFAISGIHREVERLHNVADRLENLTLLQQEQTQYVLVESPTGDAELRDKRVREQTQRILAGEH